MRLMLSILSAFIAANIGNEVGSSSCLAFAPIINTHQQFSSSHLRLHAEQPNDVLSSDLEEIQSKEAATKAPFFVADAFNDDTALEEIAALADEMSGSNKLMAEEEIAMKIPTPPSPPPKIVTPKVTPPPFDPTNPGAWIAITKSFLATDFGIQTSDDSKSEIMKSYPSSLLSKNFIWVSGNNINDGRTGVLNKDEYLAAGQYFDLRGSFPDLDYNAYDFRVFFNEGREYYDDQSSSDGEVTVRFTTLATGTFDGAPLKLRSKTIRSNGKVMKCPPASVSVTFATEGSEKGKVIKLVTDMVMDRQIGNTQGYSGIAAAAIIAGEEINEFHSQPPLVVLGRFFAGKLNYLDANYGIEHLPPFPDTVMIQLAQDVVGSNFGLYDPKLLADNFSYLEPSMGPFNKMKYLEKFTEYGILDAVTDMDYGITNYRVDPNNPYRVWIDIRAKGVRTGAIGKVLPKISNAKYGAAPEAMSFSFDDDGYCTRITAAAVLDPLLGNSGGLGGVNGLLYATLTPKSALLTRSFNSFFTRSANSWLGTGADSFRTSDGKVLNRLPSDALASIMSTKRLNPVAPAPSTPKDSNLAEDAAVADGVSMASSIASEITDAQVIASSTQSDGISISSAKQLHEKAIEARAEAAEAMERAIAFKAQVEEEKKKLEEAKLEEEERRLQMIDEAKKMIKEKEVKGRGSKRTNGTTQKEKGKEGVMRSFLTPSQPTKASMKRKSALPSKKKRATPPKTPPPKRSPTLSLLESLSGQSNASSVKSSSKNRKLAPKRSRSPTLDIFSSAPKIKKSSPTAPSSRSPTLSLLGVGGTQKSKATVNTTKRTSPKKRTPKKLSPKPPVASRSPTLSLLGINSSSDSKAMLKKSSTTKPRKKTPTLRSSKTAPSKKSPAKKTKSLQKSPPASRSPTLSLLGIGSSPDSKATPKKSSTPTHAKKSPSPPASRSPTLSLLGITSSPDSKATPKKSSTSTHAKKSPTLSLFGIGSNQQTPSSVKQESKSKPPVSKPKTDNNAFNLFGGANRATSKTATKSIVTAPSQNKKTKSKMPTKDTTVSNVTSKPNNMFSDFFGSKDNASVKKEKVANVKKTKVVTSVKKSKKVATKKMTAPKGVPILKGWTVTAKNEIIGRVHSSATFGEGEMITTSPVKGSTQSGTVVISQSGSKYYLE